MPQRNLGVPTQCEYLLRALFLSVKHRSSRDRLHVHTQRGWGVWWNCSLRPCIKGFSASPNLCFAWKRERGPFIAAHKDQARILGGFVEERRVEGLRSVEKSLKRPKKTPRVVLSLSHKGGPIECGERGPHCVPPLKR